MYDDLTPSGDTAQDHERGGGMAVSKDYCALCDAGPGEDHECADGLKKQLAQAQARIRELEQRVRESIDHAGRAQAAEARVRETETALERERALVASLKMLNICTPEERRVLEACAEYDTGQMIEFLLGFDSALGDALLDMMRARLARRAAGKGA